jgi:L-serine dehydratase
MISIFDLFSIGVGPSSSHTIGPMRAAHAFVHDHLIQADLLDQVARIQVTVHGSLAFTGAGHGTDRAILMGLEGHLPESIDPELLMVRLQEIKQTKKLMLFQKHTIAFDFEKDLIFNFDTLLPKHSNGMCMEAYDQDNNLLTSNNYYSIGGGFIISDTDGLEAEHTGSHHPPHPFDTEKDLRARCQEEGKTIAEIMLANEASIKDEATVKKDILNIARIMFDSIERGCRIQGVLPGELHVQRRAPDLSKRLTQGGMPASHKETDSIDWLNVYAIAVNEENAAGSRVVTAPTNGAAGLLPAVLKYYTTFYPEVTDDKIIDFLLTAAAIAILFKKGASISAAEVGCQGEVGVACSMAAAALTAVLGGNIDQVTSAAEIAMEHNLGLTCDPIAGLVQIPCIERNAIGAVKAVNVARLALLETGTQKKISLDNVIRSMKLTGMEMSHKYKETSQGGLAKIKVNVVEC